MAPCCSIRITFSEFTCLGNRKILSKARRAGSETPYLLVLDSGACYSPRSHPLTQVVRWFSRHLQGLSWPSGQEPVLDRQCTPAAAGGCTPASQLSSDRHRQGSSGVSDDGSKTGASLGVSLGVSRPIGLGTSTSVTRSYRYRYTCLTNHVSLLHGWRPHHARLLDWAAVLLAG